MEWKEGDTVYFHMRAGEVLAAKILHVYREWVDLEDVLPWVRISDLYPTKEEAEKALSPAGRRMAGCLREATEAYGELGYNPDDLSKRDHILKIAFQLFNTTED